MNNFSSSSIEVSSTVDMREAEERYEAGVPMVVPDVQQIMSNGLPLGDAENVLPHYTSFARTVNLLSRTYRWAFDEALRHNRHNALAIRRDPVVMDALRSRQIPVAQLEWHLEGPEDENPLQDEAIDGLTRIIEDIPRFQQLKMHLLEGNWYGRYGVQLMYEWEYMNGRRLMAIRDHLPINGDKLVFKFSKAPGILVHQNYPGTWEPTDRGRAHFFTPEEREQLIIHHYEPEDADFYEGELAGQIAGVGIRSRIYWIWYLKSQVTTFLFDYLERVGAGGFTIYYYEAGNPKSLAEVREAAENQYRNNTILFPRHKDPRAANGGPGIQRIEPSQAGAQLLQNLITGYFDNIIRRYILGQSLTSEAEGGGLGGSGVADLHGDTFARLIKYDAVSLQETLTHDLVGVLQRYNYPKSPKLRFVFDIDVPNAMQIMQAAEALYGMGGDVDEDELRNVVGLPKPQKGHAVLSQMSSLSPGAMGAGTPEGVPYQGEPGPEPAADPLPMPTAPDTGAPIGQT